MLGPTAIRPGGHGGPEARPEGCDIPRDQGVSHNRNRFGDVDQGADRGGRTTGAGLSGRSAGASTGASSMSGARNLRPLEPVTIDELTSGTLTGTVTGMVRPYVIAVSMAVSTSTEYPAAVGLIVIRRPLRLTNSGAKWGECATVDHRAPGCLERQPTDRNAVDADVRREIIPSAGGSAANVAGAIMPADRNTHTHHHRTDPHRSSLRRSSRPSEPAARQTLRRRGVRSFTHRRHDSLPS